MIDRGYSNSLKVYMYMYMYIVYMYMYAQESLKRKHTKQDISVEQ